MDLFSRIIGASAAPTVVMHLGVDDNPWDFALANPDGNEAVRDYVGVLATDDGLLHGSWASRPIWYLFAGTVAAAYLLLRRRRTDPGGVEVALLAVGAVAYETTYLLLAMGEGFRYSYPMIACSVLAVVFATAAAVTTRRSRHRRPPRRRPPTAPRRRRSGASRPRYLSRPATSATGQFLPTPSTNRTDTAWPASCSRYNAAPENRRHCGQLAAWTRYRSTARPVVLNAIVRAPRRRRCR